LPTLTSFIIPHMLDAIVLTLSFTFTSGEEAFGPKQMSQC
jgi:hypothetical protein